MSFKLGRASFTNAPRNTRQSGDRLAVDINIAPASLAAAKVLRQQWIGLDGNVDEPVVPLSWSDDDTLDGYYSVRAASADPEASYLQNGLIRATAELERVTGGFYKPLIELHATCVEVANGHSITTYGRLAHPQNGLEDYNAGPGFGEYNAARTVAVDGGQIRWSRVPSLPTSGVSSYYVPPASYYIGASTLEVRRGGTWYPVHGRQYPDTDTAGDWRVSNGLVRIYPSGSYNYRVDVYDTGSWVELVTIQRGHEDGGWQSGNFGTNNQTGLTLGTGATTTKVAPVVLRNGPERVTVRVPGWGGFEDISVLRGAGWVEVYYSRPGEPSGEQYGVGASTTIACTDEGNRAVRTSADGNGNKFFLACPAANTVDTTNGRIYLDSNDSEFRCMVGWESPAIDSTTAEYLYAFTASGVTQRVVPR